MMENYIGYVRTSTSKQILGLKEQESRIQQFIIQKGGWLIEIISEQESGKKNDRVGLEKAVSLCQKYGCTQIM